MSLPWDCSFGQMPFLKLQVGGGKLEGPGQVGLYELPTAISQSTKKYDFSLII